MNSADPNYWPAVEALGQWAAAFATFVAVLVALKQSKDAGRIKIKVTVTYGFVTGLGTAGPTLLFCQAANVGMRPARLTSTGIYIAREKHLVFPHHQGNALPANLQESEITRFSIPCKDLADALREGGYSGKMKLRLYFSDTHEVRHWKKFTFDIDKW
jgi:hypothetical protein